MKRIGHADLPLHGGTVPKWLADRMAQLSGLIIEAMVGIYGKTEVLKHLSDPLWFQSFGAVLGMDWHSSGITTSVMYALKRSVNKNARNLGICICGGRGIYSRKTPEELLFLAEATGLNGNELIKTSKLCAKIDNTAIQDGFNLYQHNFILADNGQWTIIQQGMNLETKTARRYHWFSEEIKSYVNNPHSGIVGINKGKILNLTDKQAQSTRNSILNISVDNPERIIKEIRLLQKCEENNLSSQNFLFPELQETSSLTDNINVSDYRKIKLPRHHDVKAQDVDLKKLGAVLYTAYESQPKDFESLLLTPGLGPRTLQSLTLVSEIIHGTKSRFNDPARFSFAHGGKDGHPFPVPCKIYDETIRILKDSIQSSQITKKDKMDCIERLHKTALEIEKKCEPYADFEETIKHEKNHSKEWDGKIAGD